MGLDEEAVEEAEDGDGGTLVELAGSSGEREVVRDIPKLERGRREILSGEVGVGVTSRSPYNERGRRRGAAEKDSGELGTDVWGVVIERGEFSDETDEPVEFGWRLSSVFERCKRDGEVYAGTSEVCV